MRSEREERKEKRRKEERGPTLKGVLKKKWPCLGIFSVWCWCLGDDVVVLKEMGATDKEVLWDECQIAARGGWR